MQTPQGTQETQDSLHTIRQQGEQTYTSSTVSSRRLEHYTMKLTNPLASRRNNPSSTSPNANITYIKKSTKTPHPKQ
jgi:hypothetical protein